MIYSSQFHISIIIPTHNREDALLQTLNTLSAQTFPTSQFEVIVVADGCTDDTIHKVNGFQAPYELKLIKLPGNGAAAARNKGASHAEGSILVFLDDDIIALPQLIEAHFKAHHQAGNHVVIGYSPPIMKNQKGFFRTKLKVWWEQAFYAMSLKDHRFSYRDLLSGNFSISFELFHSIGGFDNTLICQEDYELGLRLMQSHAQFVFALDAMGYHQDVTDLKRWLHRKYLEGKAEVQFLREYPHSIDTLPMLHALKNGVSKKRLNTLIFIHKWPYLNTLKERLYLHALKISEWLRMRKTWEKVLGRLQIYRTLHGILDSEGDPASLQKLLQENYIKPTQFTILKDINIKEGLALAEQTVDEIRPESINLWYGSHFIGHISAKAGFERLRGIHLRSALAKDFAAPLLKVLALDEVNHQLIHEMVCAQE